MTSSSANVVVNHDDVFQQAKAEFLKQVSAKDRKAFVAVNNPEEMLSRVQVLTRRLGNKRKGARLLGMVNVLKECLEPYLEALGMIAQGAFGYAAVAWGAIWLVIQLLSNFPSFFEKLDAILSQLSRRIPQYKGLCEMTRKNSIVVWTSSMRNSLRDFYLDFLEFFGAIAKIFTRPDGGLKRTPVIIGHLLWQPFDKRFNNFLKRLQFHQEVFASEMSIWSAACSLDHVQSHKHELSIVEGMDRKVDDHSNVLDELKQALTSEQKDTLIYRIRAWLDVPAYADGFERACALRQDGTAEWLSMLDKFENWRSFRPEPSSAGSSGKLLWIQGNPGTGKTVLAAATVSELRSIVSLDDDIYSIVSYFFFDYNNPLQNTCRSAYASLLAQVLHQCHEDLEILDLFTVALTNRRDGQSIATHSELLDLLKWVSLRLNNWFVVFDAVDECNQPDRFSESLESSVMCGNAKILLFSRPNVAHLRRRVQTAACIALTPKYLEDDLRAYFTEQLRRLQDLCLIHDDLDLDPLVQCLLKGADGMFEWARLMMAYLQSDALTESARLRAVLDLKMPEKLEDMYLRILTMIASKLPIEQHFARRVFTWLAYGKQSLAENQLHDLLATFSDEQSSSQTEPTVNAKSDRFTDFEHSLIMICSSLVELRWSAEHQTKLCRFTHHSAFEFFRMKCSAPEAVYGSSLGSVAFFHPARFEVEVDLTTTCLLYPRLRSLKGPLSGSMFEKASRLVLDEKLSFLRYAAGRWPEHLIEVGATLVPSYRGILDTYNDLLRKLLRTMKTFLTARFGLMTWVETTYTYAENQNKIHQRLLQWTKDALKLSHGSLNQELTDISELLGALVTDLDRLHDLWGDTLQAAPNQLWNDVTAFTPSPFFAQTSALSVKKLLSESTRLAGLSARPLCQISRDLSGGDLLAILTIWPSRPFETAWFKKKFFGDEDLATDIYEGWKAQYQLWNIEQDEPHVQKQWQLSLDANEVSVQVALFRKHVQTRVRGREGMVTRRETAIHFPTSIGEALNSFTVLRTVFTHSGHESLANLDAIQAEASWIRTSIPVEHKFGATAFGYMSQRSDHADQDDFTHLPTATEPDTALKIGQTSAFAVQTYKRYILYKSVDGEESASGEDHAGSMALLQISEDHQSTKWLGFVDCLEKRWPFSKCIFHPSLSLIAFYCNSVIHGPRVVVWCFTTETMRQRYGFGYITEISLRKDSEFISVIPLADEVAQSLQFTPSGEELIIQSPGSFHPKVVKLAEKSAYIAAIRERALSSSANEPEVSLALTTPSFAGKVQLAKIGTPHSMQQNEVVIHDDGSSTQLAFQGNTAGRNLHLVNRMEGLEESQALLSLPAYDDINHVNVSVRLPSTSREDKITIILNKTAKPYYTLTKSIDEAAPTVIRKDVRAVAPTRKRLLSSSSSEHTDSVAARAHRFVKI